MGRANFKAITNDSALNYPNDLHETRVINDWEHTTGGSNILTITASTGAFTGTLAITPIIGNEIRTKSGNYIKRYRVSSVTITSGLSFTGTSIYLDQFSQTTYGSPTEAESNTIWTPVILRKFRKDESKDY